jgi:hypothetical protein
LHPVTKRTKRKTGNKKIKTFTSLQKFLGIA